MKLVIVESPAKARTIEKYLGKDYKVVASQGHIRDLSLKGEGSLGVDVKNNFEPDYVINDKSKRVVAYLKKLSESASEVYLASDPDREGEAIAWHVAEVLNLDINKTKRLEFNEITKSAVNEALNNARSIDVNLVKSQETRRILDRIIGFKLSNLLQRKIFARSAGRVQSVVLNLITRRQEEIDSFKEVTTYGLSLLVNNNDKKVKFELVGDKLNPVREDNKEKLEEISSNLSKEIMVQSVETQVTNKYPFPPFTTSSLQQEAFSLFNFSASKTNKIAQKLYEGVSLGNETTGLITYMRTDSIRISDSFAYACKDYIKKNYGENYVGYVRKQKDESNVQDAHEAIRPTKVQLSPDKVEKYLSKDEYKLYKLIWDRAVASIMKAASFDETKVILKNNDDKFLAKGSVLTFEGYKKIYGVYEKSKLENIPTFIKDNLYKINKVSIDEHKNKPPYPYTEASIIKTMEEVGIGRPSTYASTLEALKKSAYITQEKKYIKPTSTGVKADEKLQEYFSDIIDVKYTANMEKDLDLIAEGEVKSLDILNDFYKPFMSKVTYAYNNMKNPDIIYTDEKCPECDGRLVKKHGRYGEYTHCENRPNCDYIKPKEVTHDEELKKCPVCGGNLVLREGKYGKFYGCSNYPKCGHTMKIYRVTKKTKKEN